MNFHIVTILFGLCAATVLSQNQIVSKGSCPVIGDPKLTINQKKYVGKWYEIKRFENTLITRPCGEADYKYEDKKSNFTVKYVTRDTEKKVNVTDTWILTPQDPKKPNNGKYVIIRNTTLELVPHQILDTDYDHYSIVWGCHLDTTNKNIQRLFIYSRNTTIQDEHLKKINKKLEEFKEINRTALIDVDQSAKLCGRSTGVSLSVPATFFFILLSLISKQI